MSDAPQMRTRLDIMRELLNTTNLMVRKKNDAEELLAGVEHRQLLIDEFDSFYAENEDAPQPTGEEMAEIRRIAGEILSKDNVINEALEKHKSETKQDISSNTRQKKVAGYMNNMMGVSGNLMDYKK